MDYKTHAQETLAKLAQEGHRLSWDQTAERTAEVIAAAGNVKTRHIGDIRGIQAPAHTATLLEHTGAPNVTRKVALYNVLNHARSYLAGGVPWVMGKTHYRDLLRAQIQLGRLRELSPGCN